MLVVAIVTVAVALAGCGGGSKSSSSGGGGGSSNFLSASTGGATSAGVEHAKQEIAEAAELPKFTPPGPAFDTSKAKGKTILSIPVSSEIAFESSSETAAHAAAAKLGINWITCQNQGQPSQWVSCMNRAVSQKVSLIDLFGGTDPSELGPQLEAAKKAGIPVVATHFYPIGYKPPAGVTATVPSDFGRAAQLDADWAISQTDGKGAILVIRSSNLGAPEKAGVAALNEEFAKYCPECKVKTIDIASSNWATQIEPAVQSALTQEPEISYIIPLYDSMSTYVEPALKAVGDTGKVGVATFNGTPAFMKILQEGGAVKMEVGESLQWIVYGMLDQEMRVMLGIKPLASENLPLRVFDSSNIDEAGTPPTLEGGYGNAYQSGYAKLWEQAGG